MIRARIEALAGRGLQSLRLRFAPAAERLGEKIRSGLDSRPELRTAVEKTLEALERSSSFNRVLETDVKLEGFVRDVWNMECKLVKKGAVKGRELVVGAKVVVGKRQIFVALGKSPKGRYV
ncbi:MAG: hypothetical protein JW873_06090 [Candidatus Saganbacteria bacterium]|nr:hypothetical protein [Candidatus Saganbacteria bacterium]